MRAPSRISFCATIRRNNEAFASAAVELDSCRPRMVSVFLFVHASDVLASRWKSVHDRSRRKVNLKSSVRGTVSPPPNTRGYAPTIVASVCLGSCTGGGLYRRLNPKLPADERVSKNEKGSNCFVLVAVECVPSLLLSLVLGACLCGPCR